MTARRALLLVALTLLVVSAAIAGVTYRVDQSRCTGCGDCYRVCPVDAVEIRDGKSFIDPEVCIGCGFCQRACTYDAVR